MSGDALDRLEQATYGAKRLAERRELPALIELFEKAEADLVLVRAAIQAAAEVDANWRIAVVGEGLGDSPFTQGLLALRSALAALGCPPGTDNTFGGNEVASSGGDSDVHG